MLTCRWLSLLGSALLVLLLAGCQPKTVKVTGTVLKDGKPMTVSAETYVTLSFIPDPKPSDDKATSYSATFDQKSGGYNVTLPPGSYRTMLIVVPPGKSGKINAPRPINSAKTYDLKSSQNLNIEVPAK